ncbi:MAG: DUF4861 domain-containing protein [Dysgonamonadaceae bacterium]|nr:DUF4861 domain-containing protein [Dysgonamonadaceae bacterium]
MKKTVLFTGVIFLAACSPGKQVQVEVANTSAVDRTEELIEIAWSNLDGFMDGQIVVLDEKGEELPSQVLYRGGETPQALLFPATVAANTTKVYYIKEGMPQTFPARTFGRQVPERKDDFAWENDRVAYRVYGPALADEYPSNGVDLWLKKTDQLIVNKFYREDIENGISYHIDYGEGLDCYKVGHTLGAGGIAPYAGGKIWVENHYSSVRLLDTGILRTAFELTYDSVVVQEGILYKKAVISLDAGSHFNQASVTYTGTPEPLTLAAGIYLHESPGTVVPNVEAGTLAYAEDAVSDAGIPAGRNYVGIVFTTPVREIFRDKEHVAGITPSVPGEPLVYYFGGGWSQWGFPSDTDWYKYVEEFAKAAHHPLEVSLPNAH